ncbi:MAG: MarR family transcriptional regulator [Deltaproteobacteria bacterium]|nr:MarR family transcriptional regulator [Deltaproteobacteria bacterium]MBW2138917.1 MarR family transcriptional regulator [Deltaproteobacteria bacterium]
MEAIGKAFLTWKRYAQREIHPYGITLKQFEILRQLKRRGGLYPAEIAEILFCDRPTVTVVIKNLERKRWVKRELVQSDFRRFKVTLRPEGEAKLKEILWDQPDYKKKRFRPTSCFTKEEGIKFKELLDKLNEHLKKIKDDV